MIAKCLLCDGSGEIDSGGVDPQDCTVACPECMGIGKLNTYDLRAIKLCCGLHIYMINRNPHGTEENAVYVAVDEDWNHLVSADASEDALCNRIYITYLCGGI